MTSTRCGRRFGRCRLATPNIGQVTDIIACPGLDYCSLANARSIPIAQRISERFADVARGHDIGELKIKISGCINACGHHHVGHIGILGVDKKGEEFYQITLGGDATETASLGAIIGPAFSGDEVADAVETLVGRYLEIARGRRAVPRHLPPRRPRCHSRRGSMPLIKEGRITRRSVCHRRRGRAAARTAFR